MRTHPFMPEGASPPLSVVLAAGTHSRNGIDWTPDLLAELRRVVDLGWPAKRIAKHMGVCQGSLARGLLILLRGHA